MKRVRVTCDECGKRVKRYREPQRAVLKMIVHGYGYADGLHSNRWDICSSACGLALLKKAIAEIECADT